MKSVPVLASLALAGVLAAQAPRGERPIDLAICLDISGSMNGLINAARQNLWAVVNELATLQPAPRLRVALLSYGCNAHEQARGWVKVESGFTEDLDLVSKRLFALTTNGGEEYVGRVIHAALQELAWSEDKAALRLLFVAGNEAATQDPQVDFRAMCSAAIARGIVVNSIYCGDPGDQLAPAWREVARLADGHFAAIDQDRAEVVTTPFDAQLAALSTALNTTYLPYGRQGAEMAHNQSEQDRNAASLNGAAAAQRCQTKGGGLYWNAGWDLVDACEDPKFKLEDLKPEDLPETMRGLSPEQRRAHVAEHKRKRDDLRKQIETLGQRRDQHVQQELRRLNEAGRKVFEQAVLDAVRGQAEGKGFQRPPREGAASRPAAAAPFAALLQEAVREYLSFRRIGDGARFAPTECRAPAPTGRLSAAEGAHGGKLYLLYANDTAARPYLVAGQPAPVGQTLVKESWVAHPGRPAAATEAGRRYPAVPTAERDGQSFHAGEFAGLFVMHKLPADTPGTDLGWIYGTLDRDGRVTSAGKVAACVHCHERAPEDRRFGLR
ncbi:MAG: cytochrome P460 family protein [Planctomycetes bacterium]|nr:cytochrome P460 family protein [Planctomycetota bacterium]